MLISNILIRVTNNLTIHCRAALHFTSILNAKKSFRLKAAAYGEAPLHTIDKYLEAEEEGKLKEFSFKKIRFATLSETDSLFFDECYERYLRRMMRDGRRHLMHELLHNTCYEIKCKQYTRMRKLKEKEASDKLKSTSEGDEQQIELDPIVLFNKAIDNCKPQVITRKVKRGGATYQVPFPLTSKESDWYSMHWMNSTLKDRPKPREKHYHEVLAQEILDASEGRGKVVKIRDDVHRLAQANKAYSHYRWG